MFDHVRAFHQPRTVQKAVSLLQQKKAKTCLVAGGTDLVLRAGRSVTDLVDITRLGLDYIKGGAKGMRIGAATTLAAIEQSPEVLRRANGILAKAAAACGTVQMRNVATIGGNLANASPAADTATPLLVMDAAVVLQTTRVKRQLALVDFFRAPHETAAKDSLLTEIILPACKANAAWSFQRFGRTELDIAIVNAAAGMQLDRNGRCSWARIALGAVAPIPVRARKAESLIIGKVVDAQLLEQAAQVALEDIQPITDVRASAEYRCEISRVLVRRALQECAQHLECEL
jgi:CO/xanthine dehydrogenase FAD-binding subunit